MAASAEPHERSSELLPQEVSNDLTGRAVWRRKARQDGEGFERAVLDESHVLVECASCRVVFLVPRGEYGDDDARIDRLHRRMRSSVSRTVSDVSGGSR